MTGLDLEMFLRLLRADLAAWVSLGAIGLVLALMAWTSFGSRRALRKCLVLSVAIHAGLVLYGRAMPPGSAASRSGQVEPPERIREIRVAPRIERGPDGASAPGTGRGGRRLADWDRPAGPLAVADPRPNAPRRKAAGAPKAERAEPGEATAPDVAAPEVAAPQLAAAGPREDVAGEPNPPGPAGAAPADAEEVAAAVVVRPVSPDGVGAPGNEPAASDAVPPEAEIVIRRRPGRPVAAAMPTRRAEGLEPPALAAAPPPAPPVLPEAGGAAGARPLPDIPEVYRPRLDPNRSALARRAGASRASEEAVDRALDWLRRHQDDDGRWNAGTDTHDGLPARGETDFTQHCPPGDLCSGACFYWEADTAMTGLALLAYLGAGNTHVEGKYAETVERGLRFLLLVQRPDGDLRGESRAVGMYCHAMATLALCEAYALTGDEKLRGPAERAVRFLVRARAEDGQAWRYAPRAPYGDTSILGWAILALKSAKEVGIEVPDAARTGALAWLKRVADGRAGGLAMYLPNGFRDREAGRVTPTMTAEAWVCRQFLGTGGPGPASAEAAAYLNEHAPGREPLNLYYWYYATLAMYQHGGADWERWNAQVRDRLVALQKRSGHASGSWDPADSPSSFDVRGGRIYSTALATLTLEVYYRYLPLYRDLGRPPALAPGPDRAVDPGARRAAARRR